MLFIGQLNSTVAGLGSPGPSGVDLIFNKFIWGSDLVLKHFECPLDKFEIWLYLSVALMIV